MQSLLNIGITIVLLLQSLGPWLLEPMKFFSFLGTVEFYIFVASAILWCYDTSVGTRTGLYLMISGGINSIFKIIFHQPRPYWYDTRVHALSTESSFGAPSGHAQNAVVVWGSLAYSLRHGWAWIVAILLMFFISLSRIYLGVHFPFNILVGWLIGILLLLVLVKLEQPIKEWLNNHSLSMQLLAAFITSMVVLFWGILVRLSLGSWTVPSLWITNAAIASPGAEPIHPLDFTDLVSSTGAFFGLAAGAILLTLQGGFNARGIWWKRIIRYLIGIAGVLILWGGLGRIFPQNETLIAHSLNYLRFTLVGIWISALAPWFFVKSGLSSR